MYTHGCLERHTPHTDVLTYALLPDVPYKYSSVCMVDGVLLVIGEDQKGTKTSAIWLSS